MFSVVHITFCASYGACARLGISDGGFNNKTQHLVAVQLGKGVVSAYKAPCLDCGWIYNDDDVINPKPPLKPCHSKRAKRNRRTGKCERYDGR
jgi:hypothetical protein